MITVDNGAAGEITDRERAQHRRNQARPGADAAAEIRKQVSAAEHFESHEDAAHGEGVEKDRNGQKAIDCRYCHFRLCCSMALSASTGANSSVNILALAAIAVPPAIWTCRRCAIMSCRL